MTFYIFIHVTSILLAFLFSLLIFFYAKGTKLHAFLGWLFVICMALSAVSSFWIQTGGWFSPLHLLSVATLYWLTRGIIAVRYKKQEWRYSHASHMLSTYIGILIAGIGVIVRHFIFPGNNSAGEIASAISACFIIPTMLKITKKFKKRI